jgi:hypothetical protein
MKMDVREGDNFFNQFEQELLRSICELRVKSCFLRSKEAVKFAATAVMLINEKLHEVYWAPLEEKTRATRLTSVRTIKSPGQSCQTWSLGSVEGGWLYPNTGENGLKNAML